MSKTPSAFQKAECWPGLWQFNPRYKLKAANGGFQNGLLAGGVWQRATIAAEKQRLSQSKDDLNVLNLFGWSEPLHPQPASPPPRRQGKAPLAVSVAHWAGVGGAKR